ncbi:MAG: hypothetical protein K5681_07780 [Treponema sp.]|nr:hypothetical protein [Treponema sp.]
MQKKEKRRFHKIFSLYLSEADITNDFCYLLELLPYNSCQDDFSDVVILYFNKSRKEKENIDLYLSEKKLSVQSLHISEASKEDIQHKRFVFVLLPKSFIALRINKCLSKLNDEDNKFTNLVFVSRRLTKKVKKYPFFTSHFTNADFCPRG